MLFSVSVFAETEPKTKTESVNYCLIPEENQKWEGIILQYPTDVEIMKLYALRRGLCIAIEEKKIGLNAAIDIFAKEHQKLISERFEEDIRKEKKGTI